MPCKSAPVTGRPEREDVLQALVTQRRVGSQMSDQQIRDKNNRLMATIRTLSGGKQEIRDASNRLLGTFEPRSNETRDQNDRLVAKGNVLSSLIRSF